MRTRRVEKESSLELLQTARRSSADTDKQRSSRPQRKTPSEATETNQNSTCRVRRLQPLFEGAPGHAPHPTKGACSTLQPLLCYCLSSDCIFSPSILQSRRWPHGDELKITSNSLNQVSYSSFHSTLFFLKEGKRIFLYFIYTSLKTKNSRNICKIILNKPPR